NLVIHDLERYVRSSPSSMRVLTPFGVVLTFVQGKFRLGQNVKAPGIDDCSARTHAEVMAVGTRIDFPGLWYLVRGLNSTTDFACASKGAAQRVSRSSGPAGAQLERHRTVAPDLRLPAVRTSS